VPHPYWWGWYSWPGYWQHLNGMGRITWNVKPDPGKKIELAYA
jgi:hypothetical protein